jgi:endoglucanase
MRFVPTALLLALAAATLGACSSGGMAPAGSNPLAGRSFYVDPGNVAAQQVSEWRTLDEGAQAGVLERVAKQPVASWFTGQPDVERLIDRLTGKSSSAGRSALLVARDVPAGGCTGSPQGAISASAYRDWIRQFAAGIGTATATVIVEPKAIEDALTGCGSSQASTQRYELLSDAIGQLHRRSNTTVYLDAGDPGSPVSLPRLADAMRRSGVAEANGFALNVASFYGVSTVVAYGRRLSKLLGGEHFVIDTSRSGNGPDTAKADAPDSCNPPGRALGPDPTTNTGIALLDAFLWVDQPGESDGSCRPGEPRAGRWWPNYALELAKNAVH